MPDVRSVNLNLLVVLDALLATGSVTRAATRVGLTQSGASNALAELRRVFDDPLFERRGHRMCPTPRALELAGPVRAGVEAFERALAPRTFDPGTLERTFHLAIPDAVQLVVLPAALARIGQEAPGVRVRAQTWPEQRVPEGLASGELDLFAGYVSTVPEDHELEVLYDESYVCMHRAGHPALEGGVLDLERWLACGHVVVSREPTGPTDVDRALADLGLRRTVVLRVDHALLVPPILAATDLMAAVDRRLGERWLADGLPQGAAHGLALAEPPVALPRGRVRLVWHRRLAHDPGACWLRRVLVEAAGVQRLDQGLEAAVVLGARLGQKRSKR